MSAKHPSITALMERLRADLGPDFFVVVDHWEDDLCATGIAQPGDHHRLVYISTYPPEGSGFAIECEVASADSAFPYKGEGVVQVATYELLVETIRAHLRSK